MKCSTVILRHFNAIVMPTWQYGPAPYASKVLTIIVLGPHVSLSFAAANDTAAHGGGAA